MFWSDLFYMILGTTFTGSILTVAWFVTSYLLEKTGYLNLAYRLSKVVVLFWIIPVVYLVVMAADKIGFLWNGYAFEVTPVIIRITRGTAVFWIAGLLFGIFIYVHKRVKILTARKDAFLCDGNTQKFFNRVKEDMGLGRRNIILRQSYRTNTAYVTGIIRPCVVINVDRFSEQELKVIFTHELMHVIHNDIFFRYLLALVTVFNFFNPLIWMFSEKFIKYAEYSCDYTICGYEEGIREYYETILNMAIRNNNLYDMLSASLYENKSSLRERMEHVMKSYNVTKKSKLVAVLLVALFTVLGSATIAGAASLIGDTSVKVAEITECEEQEYILHNTEYYEAADAESDGIIDMYDEELDDGIDTLSSSGDISWEIYAGMRRSTSSFHADSGQKIVVSVFSVSPLHTVRAGIIQPDGSKRYVLINSDSHIFELNMSGSYRVYIQNDSTDKIRVEGCYSTH